MQSIVDYAIYMLDPIGQRDQLERRRRADQGFRPGRDHRPAFFRFYTEEDRAAGVPDNALETAAREGKYEAEAWRVRKDGTPFWANVVIDAIKDEDGELIGFAKITRDMTEKRPGATGSCSKPSGASGSWSRASPIMRSTCSTRKAM